jgi:methylglutaconyl-CoA hydratase
MVAELKEAFQLALNNDTCKVVVVRSTGSAFCAGADLDYLQQLQRNTFDENLEDSSSLMELFKTIYTFPKVVITEVNGPAIAGGCGLATVADYCFASSSASFGYTEVRIGFVPAIVMVFLLRKLGEGRAKEILLSGDVFDAQKAAEIGLINKVVSEEELNEFVNGFAQKLIRKNSGASMAMVKEMVARIPELSLEDALDYAARKNAEMRETSDCKKGISSFLNKERLTWD